ncbi:hypothetical protein ACQJBY_073169 [Aegilops geniculata]
MRSAKVHNTYAPDLPQKPSQNLQYRSTEVDANVWSMVTTLTFVSLIRKQHPASMIIVASTDGQILKALYSKSYGNFLLLHPGAGIPRSGVKQLCMRMQQQDEHL